MRVQLDLNDPTTAAVVAALGGAVGGDAVTLTEDADAPVASTSTTLLAADADRIKAQIVNETNGDLLVSETGATLTAITDPGTILHPGDSGVTAAQGAVTYFTAATSGLIRVAVTRKA